MRLLLLPLALLLTAPVSSSASLLIDNQRRTGRSAARLIVVGQGRECADGVRTARRALRRQGIIVPPHVVFASLDSIAEAPDGAEMLSLNPWRRKLVAWYLRFQNIRQTPAMLYYAAGARRPTFLSSPQFNSAPVNATPLNSTK